MKELFTKTDSGPWTAGGRDVQYRVEREGDRIFLCFQRTASKGDWGYNFKTLPNFIGRFLAVLANLFPKLPYKNMETRWLAHRGFTLLWKSVQDEIQQAVSNEVLHGATHITVLGYSQGAALATLAFEDIQFTFPNITGTCIAFASPRVLWCPSAKLDERFDRLTHVTVRGDIVTMVPFAVLGYRHVGVELKVGPVSFPTPKNHYPEKYLAHLV